MLSLLVTAHLIVASMPANTHCSSWKVGPIDHEEGSYSVSMHCSCPSSSSYSAYSGPACLACTPALLPDGGDSSVGSCVRYEEQKGCSSAPGLFPFALLFLSRLFRRKRC